MRGLCPTVLGGFLVGALLCASFHPAQAARADPQVNADGVPPGMTMTVGVYENPPKLFTDADGTARGFFPDLIEAAAEAAGITILFRPCAWNDCLDQLESGVLDMMPDVAYRPERAERFRFGDRPVIHGWSHFYGDGPPVDEIADLAGRRVAILEGSVQIASLGEALEAAGVEATLVQRSSFEAVFQAVVDGEADLAVANNFVGPHMAQRFRLTRSSHVHAPEPLFLAFSPSLNPAISQRLGQAIDLMKEQAGSPFHAAYARWLLPQPAVPSWVVPALTAFAATALLGLALGAFYRGQVRRSRNALMAKAAEADAANRAKSEFLAQMSHDLRTPLNAVIGFADVMRQESFGPLQNPRYRGYAGDIFYAASYLLSLITDLLDLSRIEAGHYVLAEEWVDMSLVVEEAVRRCATSYAVPIERVQIELAPHSLRGDPRALRQMIDNLVANAFKHGGQDVSVTIAWQADTDGGLLSIRDNGAGFASAPVDVTLDRSSFPDDLAVAGPLKDILGHKAGSSGMGLRIVERLAALHGGVVAIHSVPGRGTTVSLRFPKGRMDGSEAVEGRATPA